MTQETNDVVTQELIERLEALDWKAPVPDDIQSEVRMQFNEALAGGPNMNGDAGPTLTPNHALDCIWATERIQSQSARIAELEGERRFVWKWVERGLFDANIDRLDALKTLAHYPGAPWNEGRWDVDHKPYAAKFYAQFPKASLTKDSTSAT